MSKASRNPFYNKRAWRRLSRKALVRAGFRCRRCSAPIAGKGEHNTHHIKAVRERPDLAMLEANHKALCLKCHRQVETHALNPQQGCDARGFPIGRSHPWNQPNNGVRL